MFPCPLGGVVIDTPGMREIGAESADLSKTFAEIEELAQHCRFHDCTHTTGLGCAVLAAVESGESDSRRPKAVLFLLIGDPLKDHWILLYILC